MDTSYLMTQADTSVLKNISDMGQHLEKLKETMLQKEAEAKQAKQEYEHYDSVQKEIYKARRKGRR